MRKGKALVQSTVDSSVQEPVGKWRITKIVPPQGVSNYLVDHGPGAVGAYRDPRVNGIAVAVKHHAVA